MELTDKVYIDNLCSWPLYFKRLNGMGDVRIPANAKRFAGMDVAEVQMQIQSGNKMIVGDDQNGSHARLFISDESQRKELLGLEDSAGKTDVVALNEASVSSLLSIRSKRDFNERLNELVKTDAEKRMITQLAKEMGGNEAAAWKMEAIAALAETSQL